MKFNLLALALSILFVNVVHGINTPEDTEMSVCLYYSNAAADLTTIKFYVYLALDNGEGWKNVDLTGLMGHLDFYCRKATGGGITNAWSRSAYEFRVVHFDIKDPTCIKDALRCAQPSLENPRQCRPVSTRLVAPCVCPLCGNISANVEKLDYEKDVIFTPNDANSRDRWTKLEW